MCVCQHTLTLVLERDVYLGSNNVVPLLQAVGRHCGPLTAGVQQHHVLLRQALHTFTWSTHTEMDPDQQIVCQQVFKMYMFTLSSSAMETINHESSSQLLPHTCIQGSVSIITTISDGSPPLPTHQDPTTGNPLLPPHTHTHAHTHTHTHSSLSQTHIQITWIHMFLFLLQEPSLLI